MLAEKFKAQFADTIMDFLWRQWSKLGVFGHMNKIDNNLVIDVEALLIFSSSFCRYDQRLYDLIIDWLIVNESLINIQRLKTLFKEAYHKDGNSLAYIAAQLNAHNKTRWHRLAKDYSVVSRNHTQFMFTDITNDNLNFCPHEDEIALKYGFSRSPYIFSGKITSMPNAHAATLLLRMRGILGVSARAETILILLEQKKCLIQELATKSNFAWKSIQDVLEELMLSGYVESVTGDKRGKYYILVSPAKIKSFFNVDSFSFIAWQQFFNIISILWSVVSNPNFAQLSDLTFYNEISRSWDTEVKPILFTFELDKILEINSTEFELDNVLDCLSKL